MANDFFNVSGWPGTRSQGASAPGRSEIARIAAAFDKFPALIGNGLKTWRINAAGTSLEIDPNAYLPMTSTGFDALTTAGVNRSKVRSAIAASALLLFQNSVSGSGNTDGLEVGLGSDGTTASIWNYENGILSFGVNNAEGMRLTTVGLGVGGSPIAKLSVAGGATISTLTDWNTKANAAFVLANPAVRLGVGYTAADLPELQGFDSTNTARDIVLQRLGGNVGIGGTPTYRLDVQWNTGGAQRARLFNASNGAGDSTLLDITNGTSSLQLLQRSTAAASANESVVQNNSGGQLTLQTVGATSLVLGTAATARLTINAAGNGTMAAPSSGGTLTLIAAAGQPSATFQAAGTSDAIATWNLTGSAYQYQTYIKQSDNSLRVRDNIAGADRLQIAQAGNFTFSTPSSGFTAQFNSSNSANLKLDTSTAAQDSTLYFFRNGTAFSIHGNAGTAGDIVNDSAVGDQVVRVENHDLRFSTDAGATSSVIVTAAGLLNIKSGSGNLRVGGNITRFESGEQSCPTTTAIVSVAHGGPRKPDYFQAVWRCKTAEHGYVAGDEIVVKNDIAVSTRETQVNSNATNVALNYVGAASTPAIRNTSGSSVGLTAANWRLVFYAIWL